MNRTLSSLHYNRPDHSRQALEAISKVVGLAGWEVHVFIDPCPDRGVTEQIRSLASACAFVNSITVFPKKQGVYPVPLAVLHYVFDKCRSDFHVYTEDDTLIGPDGLHFISCCEPLMDDRFGMVTLHGHPDITVDCASPEVDAFSGFRSNWIYAVTRGFFYKHVIASPGFSPKRGYDWSLNAYMAHHRLMQIRSMVRRSKNIGFTGGAHADSVTTPDLKDRWTGGRIPPPWHYDFRPLIRLKTDVATGPS